MALEPTINLCLTAGCTTLTFTETTDTYNAISNDGGYGAPNIVPADAESATLYVTDPDGEEYTIVLVDFPSDDPNREYEIDLAEELGGRTSIEDGYWQFTYKVVDGATTYTGTKNYFFYCNAQCCVDKLLSKVEPLDCDCDPDNDERINKYTKVRTFLSSLKNAANCFNTDKFNKILSLVNKLCVNVNCKTCN